MPNISPLESISCDQDYGRKAYYLGAIARAGLTIPYGIAISNQFLDELFAGGHQSDIDAGERALIQLLNEKMHWFKRQPAVAVRSSSLFEDSPNLSYAGRYDTYFCKPDSISIAEKAWKIVTLSKSPKDKGDTDKMSVIIQSLVQAEVSGVAFSRGLGLGFPDDCLIEASWGLGMSVAHAEVEPDYFRVNLKNSKVLESRAGRKETAYAWKEGFINKIDVAQDEQLRLSLSQVQVLQVAAAASHCESVLESPADIEFAFKGEKLFIVQARPITTHGRNLREQ